jgi:N-acetyl-anhydromuramyl-L-alanine amidase AmpD
VTDSLQSRVTVLDNAGHHGGERGAGPAMIVWHSIRSRMTAREVIDYLNSTNERVASYHYVIDRDGGVVRMCRPEFVAWHAGDSAWPHPIQGNGTEECRPNGGKSVNGISLGFAFATMDAEGELPTALQLESALWLAKVYMARYDIPPSLNVAHKEVSPGRKTDPIGFDMSDWRSQIGALFA